MAARRTVTGVAPSGEDALDLAPRGEVLGEAAAELPQPAQVDDPLEARSSGRAARRPRRCRRSRSA